MAINQLTLPLDTTAGSNLVITVPIGKTDVFKQVDRIDIEVVSTDGGGFSDLISIEKAAGKPNELMEANKPVTLNLARGRFDPSRQRIKLELSNLPPGAYELHGTLLLMGAPIAIEPTSFRVSDTAGLQPASGAGSGTTPPNASTLGGQADPTAPPVRVSMVEPNRFPTPEDQGLWRYIRNGTLNFKLYKRFVDEVMFPDDFLNKDKIFPEPIPTNVKNRFNRSPLLRTDAYSFLKQATDFFMDRYFYKYQEAVGSDDALDNTSLPPNFETEVERKQREASEFRRTLTRPSGTSDQAVSYFEQILDRLPEVANVISVPQVGEYNPFRVPNLTLLELIWSYWHEEGGLVQTLNAISLRFQNVRTGNGHDPLAALNIDPLRPLNNLIWGYIQDERFRLSLAQRNFEYQYEYGISLIGKAIPSAVVAESRSQFIPAFHNLLKTATDFYQQANYTTVIPDGFPILNHLREVHLLLAEGAHNSFRDLPYTARAEMLTQQWILARPEMREFLGGRIMVPYSEPWMDRVDTMKAMQGWDPANITHFHDLGRFGEQLLLSIRYGNWNGPNAGALNAANWAHYWREEIQRYVHAYKAVTGVDLTADITDARFSLPPNSERYEQPAVLINRRVGMLPPGQERMGGMNQLTRQRVLREG